MTVLSEGDLEIKIPPGVKARKFDDSSHGLSHCMKAVDFIVELKDRSFFIEFKDPQNPDSKSGNEREFVEKFLSGNIDEDFKYKYRDSFLYEWASGKAEKPIYYYVLIAMDTLTEAELATRIDDLKRKLPCNGSVPRVWKRQIVAGCGVFNIATWNKHMKSYRVSRISSQKNGLTKL